MTRVSSCCVAGSVEALAEIHHGDHAVAVGQHALEERRGVGQRRGLLPAKNALDLKDAERQSLGTDLKDHELQFVVGHAWLTSLVRSRSSRTVRFKTGTHLSC